MSQSVAKATVEVGNTKVTFEGPPEFVESQVAKYTEGTLNSSSKPGSVVDSDTAGLLTEKQLVLTKKPKGHSETVAVLAFALAQSGKEGFTEEDMRKAYIRAGVRPPKVVSQAIRDAKNSFDFVETTSEKGVYRLSSHGDRTVRFDLPRAEK